MTDPASAKSPKKIATIKYKTDPVPEKWVEWSYTQRKEWLRDQADPKFPTVSLGSVMEGNYDLYEHLGLFSKMFDGIKSKVVELDALKNPGQKKAVQAVFDALDAVLVSYSEALYSTAEAIDKTGRYMPPKIQRDGRPVRRSRDPDAKRDKGVEREELKQTFLRLLNTAESSIPALQKRSTKMGVAYADLVNLMVEAVLGVVFAIIWPLDDAEPKTLTAVAFLEHAESGSLSVAQLCDFLDAKEEEIRNGTHVEPAELAPATAGLVNEQV